MAPLFDIPGGEGGIVATSRTYNLESTGTLGQFGPAQAVSQAMSRSDGAVTALHIDKSADFRTNVGFINTTSAGGDVTVDLISKSGELLASKSYTLKPYAPFQINDVFGKFGVPGQLNARVEFSVTGNGKILGYATVIDNRTNDPVYVTAVPIAGGSDR